MVSEGAAKIERVVLPFAARRGRFKKAEGVVDRPPTDLASKLERAVDLLREMVELVHPEAPLPKFKLTPREFEILTHLAAGRSNPEIAETCRISENTVKFHLNTLFRKLMVRDRRQAIMIARDMVRRLD